MKSSASTTDVSSGGTEAIYSDRRTAGGRETAMEAQKGKDRGENYSARRSHPFISAPLTLSISGQSNDSNCLCQLDFTLARSPGSTLLRRVLSVYGYRCSPHRHWESRRRVYPLLQQSRLLPEGRKQHRMHTGLHQVRDQCQCACVCVCLWQNVLICRHYCSVFYTMSSTMFALHFSHASEINFKKFVLKCFFSCFWRQNFYILL